MPYDFNAEEHLAAVTVAKVARLSRDKMRQSVILTKSNKSVLGSMYSVVSRAIKMNKYVWYLSHLFCIKKYSIHFTWLISYLTVHTAYYIKA